MKIKRAAKSAGELEGGELRSRSFTFGLPLIRYSLILQYAVNYVRRTQVLFFSTLKLSRGAGGPGKAGKREARFLFFYRVSLWCLAIPVKHLRWSSLSCQTSKARGYEGGGPQSQFNT